MAGQVHIDGVGVDTIQPHDLSEEIGSVFQNPRSQLFTDSVYQEMILATADKKRQE